MRTYRFSGMVLGFEDQNDSFGQFVFQPEGPAASVESRLGSRNETPPPTPSPSCIATKGPKVKR